MPPKKNPKKNPKSRKLTCDLCCGSLELGQEQLVCEGGCGCKVHHYCAGVTTKHYAELTNSSTPFVCFLCSQKLFKTMINQLQLQVDMLKSELDEAKMALKEKEQTTAATSPATYASAVQSHIVCAKTNHNDHKQRGKQKEKKNNKSKPFTVLQRPDSLLSLRQKILREVRLL